MATGTLALPGSRPLAKKQHRALVPKRLSCAEQAEVVALALAGLEAPRRTREEIVSKYYVWAERIESVSVELKKQGMEEGQSRTLACRLWNVDPDDLRSVECEFRLQLVTERLKRGARDKALLQLARAAFSALDPLLAEVGGLGALFPHELEEDRNDPMWGVAA